MKKITFIALIFSVIILIGCAQQTKYVCSNGTTVSDASLCPKEEKSQQIYFSLESFNPVWAVYTGYKCEVGKLTIQANTLNSAKHIELPSDTYLNCYFKVGNYIKENIIPNGVKENVGDFDTAEGHSVTLCCKALNIKGEEFSEEYCRTEYIEPLC